MKKFPLLAALLALLLLAGNTTAEFPHATLHVVVAGKSEIHVRPGDFIQLEHTYLILQSAVKDTHAGSTEKCVCLERTLRVIYPAHIGLDKETVAALFKAERPGKALLTFEATERNGRRIKMICAVIVK